MISNLLDSCVREVCTLATPAAASAAPSCTGATSRAATRLCAGTRAISGTACAPSFETLLTSSAIGPSVAALAVITERAASRVPLRLITIAALGLSLALIEVACTVTSSTSVVTSSTAVRLLAGTTLGLPVRGLDRLVRGRCPVLGLQSGPVLLIKVGLSGAALLP